MNLSPETMRLAKLVFETGLGMAFDCHPRPLSVVADEITDRDGTHVHLKWVTQEGTRYITHAEGRFYPNKIGGEVRIFPRLRVPGRPELDQNQTGRNYRVTCETDGSILVEPMIETAT